VSYNRATKMKNSPEPSDPIAEGRHTWTEGVKTADAARVISTFCDDIVLMPPNETSLYGKGEAMEWLELSPAPSPGERGLNEWTLKK